MTFIRVNPEEVSPIQIRQSDIASWQRCPQQVKLSRQASDRGERRTTLSATVFGTVVHHAAEVLQRLHHEGRTDALDVAIATFEHYWHPDHLDELEPGGIDVWLPRQTWGGLQIRGRNTLRAFYDDIESDDSLLLALEQHFEFPLDLSEELPQDPHHTGSGTIDRLTLRTKGRGKARQTWLSVDDGKTGKKPTYLRYAFQWTYYSYATLQPEFWDAWEPDQLKLITAPLAERGLALYARQPGAEDLPIIPRRGRWYAWKDNYKVHDCGWRTEVDYKRMKVALAEYVRSNTANIFPLTISGDSCMFCEFGHDGTCGGTPLAEITEGEPTRSF